MLLYHKFTDDTFILHHGLRVVHTVVVYYPEPVLFSRKALPGFPLINTAVSLISCVVALLCWCTTVNSAHE